MLVPLSLPRSEITAKHVCLKMSNGRYSGQIPS